MRLNRVGLLRSEPAAGPFSHGEYVLRDAPELHSLCRIPSPVPCSFLNRQRRSSPIYSVHCLTWNILSISPALVAGLFARGRALAIKQRPDIGISARERRCVGRARRLQWTHAASPVRTWLH
jgi:hypothetical protein